jgi:hypothetical protein
MAKDRYSNQKKNNYQKSFTAYTPSVKCNLVFTKQQRIFISEVLELYKEELNSWEKDFLVVLYHSATYSQRQKDTLQKIIKQLTFNKIIPAK